MRPCAAVLALGDHGRFELYTSALALGNCFYFSEKKFGKSAAKLRLEVVANHMRIARCDDMEVRGAFNSPAVHDFEDGLQYFAARRESCKAIITYDPDGFYYSDIPVYTPEDFLTSLLKKVRKK